MKKKVESSLSTTIPKYESIPNFPNFRWEIYEEMCRVILAEISVGAMIVSITWYVSRPDVGCRIYCYTLNKDLGTFTTIEKAKSYVISNLNQMLPRIIP